jgi:hypothetical protein
MASLLADVVLDEELVAALRVLTTEPADVTSVDAFLQVDHRVPREVRARLLGALDRFGVAYAVLALHRGLPAGALPAQLRQLSGVDAVVAQLSAVAAPLRYQRVCAALAELRALAAQSPSVAEPISEFLVADATVVAVMGAAVEVVEAAGLAVDHGDDPATHLGRAVHWRTYSRGPVNALHRSCGADICRGSLRMFERAR